MDDQVIKDGMLGVRGHFMVGETFLFALVGSNEVLVVARTACCPTSKGAVNLPESRRNVENQSM